jgi:hypothetical protein|tara:strand:- start:173 stop:388 length:216 start_codon:yes stop_codon:yes gene_type:complete
MHPAQIQPGVQIAVAAVTHLLDAISPLSVQKEPHSPLILNRSVRVPALFNQIEALPRPPPDATTWQKTIEP